MDAKKRHVCTVTLTRVDYCNSVLAGLSDWRRGETRWGDCYILVTDRRAEVQEEAHICLIFTPIKLRNKGYKKCILSWAKHVALCLL